MLTNPLFFLSRLELTLAGFQFCTGHFPNVIPCSDQFIIYLALHTFYLFAFLVSCWLNVLFFQALMVAGLSCRVPWVLSKG
jgi:hypothetical protein